MQESPIVTSFAHEKDYLHIATAQSFCAGTKMPLIYFGKARGQHEDFVAI
jgi:hypothetical protein